jgi:hypothetical protein
MDQPGPSTARLIHPSAKDDDETEPLPNTRWPLISIRHAPEQRLEARGRHSRGSSKDLESIDEDATSHHYRDMEHAGATTVRRRSPHPTSASSLLRRLSTLAAPVSPLFRNKSTRKALGKYNEIGDDYNVDSVPVDLSSLIGMGFKMTEIPRAATDDFTAQETAYASPRGESDKPGFDNFVRRAPKIGDGLVVGAELKFDPSKIAPDRAKSSSRRPEQMDVIQRSKTIRKIGQNMAQEKQTIVTVKEKLDEGEGVDLSSFEGSDLSHRLGSQTLDSMPGMSQGRAQTTALSYFFPEDPDIPNWRPFSMSTWYISLLIGISLGLAIFQEWLCRHSLALKAKKPTSGILEFNRVAEVPLWDFFAWKCKFCTGLFLTRCLTHHRPANNSYNLLRCAGFHHGFRHSTIRTILPTFATPRQPSLAQSQLGPSNRFPILCASASRPDETMGCLLLDNCKHRGINGGTIPAESVGHFPYEP